MKSLARAVLAVLSSSWLLLALGLLWLIAIWSSIYYISPGGDDAHYILTALGFISYGEIGLVYIEHFHEFFLIMPTYSFFHGLFYLAWDSFGLPINYYTYKIFHLLMLNVLIYAVAGFIYSLPAVDRSNKNCRAILILVLMAVTPFTLDIFNPRPETIGLLATVLALMCFARANGTTGAKTRGYPAAGFCLGISAVTHPSFSVTSAGLALAALILVFRNGKPRAAIAAIVLGFLPALIVVIWYVIHLPESLETLLVNVGGRTSGTSSFGATMLTVVDYIMLRRPPSGSIAVRLYWGLPFMALCLVLLAILPPLWRDLFRRSSGPAAQLHCLLWIFLAMSIINVLISPSGRIQIYTVTSFAAVLLFAIRFRGLNHTSEDARAAT